MRLHDWIYSVYPPDSGIDGRYGPLHLGVWGFCIVLVILIAVWGRRRPQARQGMLSVLAGAIVLLELARRIINLSRGQADTLIEYLVILVPRPWCAISCWLTVTAIVAKKRVLYNLSAMCSLLCALVFFAWPSVGFHHRVILFENLYSIATHSLLLVSSLSMMTLGFADFRLNRRELLCTVGGLVGIFLYAAAEILLKIEKDPLYFLPGNDVQAFLKVEYPVFLGIYAGFLCLYFCSFYAVQYLAARRKHPAPAKAG